MNLHLTAVIALFASTACLACSSAGGGKEESDGGGGKGGPRAGASGEGGTTHAGGASDGGDGKGGASGSGNSESGGVGATGGVDGVSGASPGGTSGTSGTQAMAGAEDGGAISGASPGGTSGTQAMAGAGDGGAIVGGGTGSSEEPGLVTFDTFGFYRPALISGPDGGLHMAFNTNTSPSSVEYAECAADCGVGANWTVTVIGTHEFAGTTRLAVGSNNRLHLLYDATTTSGSNELIYATCASQCDEASNWTATNLAPLFNGAWNSPTNGAPLVIDEDDRISFTVDRKIYTDGGVSLATCARDCSALGNWSTGTISAIGTRTSLAARGTTLHQLIDNASGSGAVNALSYRTCAADCTDPSNWQAVDNLFIYDGAMPNAIAVTAEGGVRVAYNQGESDSSQPAEIRAQDDRMLIWGCDTDCLEVSSWSGFISGDAGDGADGISMAELGGSLVLSVSNGARVLTRFCGQDCLQDTNWQEADIDTGEAMAAQYDPLEYGACSGAPPQSATWNLTQGVATIRPDGSVAFAHVASILRVCVGSTSVEYIPGFGRVVYLP